MDCVGKNLWLVWLRWHMLCLKMLFQCMSCWINRKRTRISALPKGFELKPRIPHAHNHQIRIESNRSSSRQTALDAPLEEHTCQRRIWHRSRHSARWPSADAPHSPRLWRQVFSVAAAAAEDSSDHDGSLAHLGRSCTGHMGHERRFCKLRSCCPLPAVADN